MYMPRTLYVEKAVLASSTHAFLFPYSSCRFALLLVSTSLILMFLAPCPNIETVLAHKARRRKMVFFMLFLKLFLIS